MIFDSLKRMLGSRSKSTTRDFTKGRTGAGDVMSGVSDLEDKLNQLNKFTQACDEAMPSAAGDEGEAQYQQCIAQDRADQRCLDHGDEAGLQREDADEEFRQVANRRLDYARRAGPR